MAGKEKETVMRLTPEDAERYRKARAGDYYFVQFGGEIPMATKTVVICDGCGKEKGETNHWWHVTLFQGETFPMQLRVEKFGNNADVRMDTKDLCGEECVVRMVQGWMATGKLWNRKPDKEEIPAGKSPQ